MRVLIIGIRSFHAKKLAKEFPKLTIDALCVQDRHHRGSSENYDCVISLIKFTSHKTEELFSHCKNYTRINGGYTSVKHFLANVKVPHHA